MDLEKKMPRFIVREEVKKGVYCDAIRIMHNPYGFTIDFAQGIPEETGEITFLVHSRIVMSPQHAKAMLLALEENVKKWEASFGEVKLKKEPGVYMR